MQSVPDAWVQELESYESLSQDIAAQLVERNKYPQATTAHARLTNQIRQQLLHFNKGVRRLKEQLGIATFSNSSSFTHREVERRYGLLDGLESKERRLQEAFIQGLGGGNREELLTGPGPGLGVAYLGTTGWGVEETDETRDMSTSDLLEQHRLVREKQDHDLESLSHVISRQKNIAKVIGTEVEEQNEIIDDIIDHVDRTGERLIQETDHVKVVDKKSSTGKYWVIVVLLLIAIIVILAIPT